jgi:pyruvate ferredoxin oxidoreductase alpha subunit/phenylglyoxylate dehydrogenase alpha subunit
MQNALRVIGEVHAAWGERFGRHHAPLVEEYRLEDADFSLITIGGMTGAAKDAVDAARDDGDSVGLIKIKTFRPFPLEAMVAALSKVDRVGVVDRSVSFGWNSGPVYQDTLGALSRLGRPVPAISFIGGLAGADLTSDHFARAIEITRDAAWGRTPDGPVWLNEDD